MFYVMSDLHGCYDKYVKMLEKISFSDNDTLFILGDVVDRGNGGIKILQDMINRRNVITIMGNHDFIAHRMLRFFNSSREKHNSEAMLEAYRLWLMDGGAATYNSFIELDNSEQNKILSFINSFLIYDEIEVDGRKFFLSHTVPEKARMQDLGCLSWQAFIVGEPEFEKQYFDNKYIVVGHTPTGLIAPEYKGRIYDKNNFYAVDCGAVFGNPLGCICLDTLETYYVD